MRALGVLRSFVLRSFVLAIGFATLLAGPAAAIEDAGFGGVHGWGGLYRENHDVGHFPVYVYDGPRTFWQPAVYVDEHSHRDIRAALHVPVHPHVAARRHGLKRSKHRKRACR